MNSNRSKIYRPSHRNTRMNEGKGGTGGMGVNAYTTLGALGCCLNSCPTIIQPVCQSGSLYDKDAYDEHDLAAESIERYSQRRENDRRRRRRERTDKEDKKKFERLMLGLDAPKLLAGPRENKIEIYDDYYIPNEPFPV